MVNPFYHKSAQRTAHSAQRTAHAVTPSRRHAVTPSRLIASLGAAFLLYACTPPGNSGPQPDTVVSGKVTTPAGKPMPDAEVRAEVEGSAGPADKVKVNKDGSYSLGVFHSGSFTLTAGYTGEGGNYQSSDPKPFNDIKAKNMNGQDIALKYGHTTTLSGQVVGNYTSSAGGRGTTLENNAAVIVEVEGIEVTKYRTRRIGGIGNGAYSISNIAHNGTLVIKVNHSSRFNTYKPYFHTLRTTAKGASHTINLFE